MGEITDINGDGVVTLADVDNYPLGWADGTGTKGPEDVDRDGDGVFDLGDALNVAWTDSWDDSLPTGCQGQTYFAFGDPRLPTDCFDGLRNFNQMRPGVFDGGYAIDAYDMGHLPAAIATKLNGFYAQTAVSAVGFAGLIPGDYIVATAVPPGYELLREEHKNVDFGDDYVPSPQAEPPFCVGDDHVVPEYLAMQTVPDGLGGFTPVVPNGGADPGALRRRDASAVRPQERLAVGRPERRGGLLPDDRRAGRGQRDRRHPQRPGQRVQPERAGLRREVRAAVAAGRLLRLERQRREPRLRRPVRQVQRGGPVDLHRQPADAFRHGAEHAGVLQERRGPDTRRQRRAS